MWVTNETPDLTWTLTDSLGGATWIPRASISNLTNGKPRVGVRFVRESGVLSFSLRGAWSAPSRPRVFAMLGLGDEWAGRGVAIQARNASTGAYSITISNFTESIRLPDGSLAIFVIIPESAYNADVNGWQIIAGTSAPFYTVGEVVLSTITDWCIRRDWFESVEKLTKQNQTVTGQPFNVPRVQRRKASVTIAPIQFSKAYSVSQVQTLQKLQSRLSQNQPVLVFPALRSPGLGAESAVDTDVAFAGALFGYCSNLGQISLVDGSNLAELKIEFTEAPAGRIV
jgi:hypothetical protein